jgi:thiol-disulfide isomerase/thioredoxin
MTGKVVHRQQVASFLKDKATGSAAWYERVGSLLERAATDGDLSVRELGLAALWTRKDPRLFGLARLQLLDADPQVRQLGVNYLRYGDSASGVPVLMMLLEDHDAGVVASAEIGIARWTGTDFGVRSFLAIPDGEGPNRGKPDPVNLARIRSGVDKRKEWWAVHKSEYQPAEPVQTRQTDHDLPRPPVADFVLPDLRGKKVRLSDYKGRTVLINFWASWCTACLPEIPGLVQLQARSNQDLVILSVALDGARDEHGHTAGEHSGKEDDHETASALRKIERAAGILKINYPVLLEPTAKIGGRFNGGELPTTIIIGKDGRLKRRFLGGRDLEVFEAMLGDPADLVRMGAP